MKLLLTIAYDGTAYHGYQVQSGQVTVQEKLNDAVCRVFGKRYPVTGCSRTDSGVHALDFKATVTLDGDAPQIPADRVPLAMNIMLPADIAVKSAVPVPDSFHPRYDVKSKEYRYRILNSRIRDPFLAGRAYQFPVPLDTVLMNRAAGYFVGTHDFSAFTASGSDVADRVRTVYNCSVTSDGDIVTVTVSGNGFLYNMVRIIAGTLIDVSCGKICADSIPEIIASLDRERAGFTAPACGLYLYRVEYDSDFTEGGTRT